MSDKLMLALSTSSGVAQVCATTQSGELAFEYEITEYKQQSARLLPELQHHLAEQHLTAASFAGISVNIGPGGFTSLRTACGLAQGLSVAWGLPCYPESSFDVLLEQAKADGANLQGQGLVLLDARLSEFYAAKYLISTDDGAVEQRFLLSTSESQAKALLSSVDWLLVDASSQEILSQWMETPSMEVSSVTAKALARRAWIEKKMGRGAQAHDCQPLYVREKVADTTAERLAIKHGKD